MSRHLGLKAELRQAGRFGLVGLAATALHLITAQAALFTGLEPVSANLMGFLTAFILGLIGHYCFSFGRAGSFRRAAWRYGVIAAAGFAINNVVLIALVTQNWLREEAALAIAILIVPAGTFLASRFWGFSSPGPQGADH